MTTNHRFDRSSFILKQIMENEDLKRSLTIGKLTQALGPRAFGIAILIFALMNILPLAMVPGYSIITSIPIFFFGMQLLLGLTQMWLPKKILNFRISHQKLSQGFAKSLPYFEKLESLLHPRWLWMTSKPMERLIGLFFVLISVFLILPIPFTNAVFGVIIALVALGLIERDGLFLTIGLLSGTTAMISLSFTGVYLTQNLFKWLFSSSH